MFRTLHLSLLPLLCFSSLHALVEHTIDEKKPLSVTLSTASHNRISIEHAAVEKIFASEAYFHISIDRTTGNAFVTVLKKIPDPITLTVVTSSGLIQDLVVISTDGLSEHLILKEKIDEEDEIDPKGTFHEYTVAFLNEILEGFVPFGYGLRNPNEKDSISLPKPLMASVIKVFEGPYEKVVVYGVTNAGKDPIVMSSESLKTGNASWVFLNAHELKAKEKALCIISYPKHEG